MSVTLVVATVTFALGVVLALLGRAGYQAGKSTRVAGPLRTTANPWEQAVGVGVFVVGVLLMWAALEASGWLV